MPFHGTGAPPNPHWTLCAVKSPSSPIKPDDIDLVITGCLSKQSAGARKDSATYIRALHLKRCTATSFDRRICRMQDRRESSKQGHLSCSPSPIRMCNFAAVCHYRPLHRVPIWGKYCVPNYPRIARGCINRDYHSTPPPTHTGGRRHTMRLYNPACAQQDTMKMVFEK